VRDWGDGNIPAKRDPITQPAHYVRGKIEVVQAIQSLDLDYCAGNAVKYLCRFQSKNGLEDLRKARQYITLMIDNYEDWYGE
jgi:hypothetical protein